MVKKTVLQTYSFREGLRDGLPIALGYLTVAFGFGLTAVQAGLYPLTALILSLINETSAGQTAGLSVIAAHGTLIEMALTQFIINLRYSLMAISLSQRVDASFTVPARLFLGFSITDEIFAVGTRYFSGIALLLYFAWAAGTLIGALAGAFLPPLVSQPMGIMLYGMFFAIILPPARRERGVLVAVLIGAACACLFRYLPGLNRVGSGFAVIISGVAGALAAAWLFPVPPEPEREDADAPKEMPA